MGQSFNPSFSAPDGTNPLSYLNPDTSAQVLSVRAVRAPTSTDRRHKIGTQWTDTSTDQVYSLVKVVSNSATWAILGPGASDVDTITGDSGGALSPAGGNINILGGTGISTSGAGSTLTLNASAGQASMTEYVVDAAGTADYTTIQAALTAADGAGGAQVFVRPGTYTEDLTLFDACPIWGASEQDTIITGMHTPPASGAVNIFRVRLNSATHILNSAAAGSTNITLEDCTINATAGYLFNLANWTGTLAVFDLASIGTNDGFVTNTGGATVLAYAATVGNGTGNDMTLSGTTQIQYCDVACPVNPQTGASLDFADNVFRHQINLDNDSTGTIVNCAFETGGDAAIDMGSSAAIRLSDCSIHSTNNPAIDGAGAGTLTYENVAFTSNAVIAATLTTARGVSVGGTARFTTFDTDVAAAASTLTAITWAADGTDAAIGLTVTPKGTGTLSLADVTSGTTVTVANAVNTVAQTVNVANGACAGDSTVNIQSGNSTSGTQTVNIGSGSRATVISVGDGVGGNSITVGDGINTSAQTVDISAGAAAADSTVNILSGIATAGTSTLNLGTGAYGKAINVGTGAAVVNTIVVGGTGANVITIGDTQTAGSISMGDAMTGGTISIGGSGLQTGAISIAPGTGAQTVSVANGAGVKTINVGNGVDGNAITVGNGVNTSAQTVSIANGAAAANSTVNILSGAASAGTQTLNLGGGDFAKSINIGTGAAVVATIDVGGTGANVITIGDNQTAGSVSIGDAMTGGTITIGGSGAQTGTIAIAPGTGAQALTIATSTGVKTIDVGTGAAANVITIGTTDTTAALNLDAGSGGISMTGDVDVDAGDLKITAAAKQLQVEGGAVTDFIGQATLVNGTITVANTNIATTDRIFVTRSSVAASTTLGDFVTTISAATSFTIEAAQTGTPGSAETGDVSIVDYFIVRQL